MPKLKEIPQNTQNELCRNLAKVVYDCISSPTIVIKDGISHLECGEYHARVYKEFSELGIVDDNEFYGNSFSPERVEVLDNFKKIHKEASDLGDRYTKLLQPLDEDAPNFALKAETLVRMWCVAQFSSILKGDGAFSNLMCSLHEDGIEDEDGSGDENDENCDSDESESEDSDDNLATSSDENDSDSDSGSHSDNDTKLVSVKRPIQNIENNEAFEKQKKSKC
tara:strand:+ start:3981 stop:4649 length:669 start_codon:yes stop_codon:yes gene_type:complete